MQPPSGFAEDPHGIPFDVVSDINGRACIQDTVSDNGGQDFPWQEFCAHVAYAAQNGAAYTHKNDESLPFGCWHALPAIPRIPCVGTTVVMVVEGNGLMFNIG
jgi:hypothetical protein